MKIKLNYKSYDDIPVGIYADMMKISDTDNPFERDLELLCILTGAEQSDLLELPLSEYSDLAAQARSWITTQPRACKVAKRYTLGDLVLVPTTDIAKLTSGQFIDYSSYAKLITEQDDKMAEVLSVILVPEGHKYGKGYDVLDVQTAIREHLPITAAAALCDFFAGRLVKYAESLLTYSEKKALPMLPPDQREKMKEDLRKCRRLCRSGATSRPLTLYLRLPERIGMR